MTISTYDFIVVGAGPSGASLAHKLSCAPGEPSVLLLEAGEANEEPNLRIAGERNTFWASGGSKLDRGYVTAPQAALNNRELAYHRGTGLGGSSATNIGVWDYGCKPDMDEWAKQVGDDWWKWSNVQARFAQIENLHDLTPEAYRQYVQPNPAVRGKSGPVDVTYPAIWDPCLPSVFEAIKEHKIPLNTDISSEKGIGMGVAPATVLGTSRVTSSSAYLKAPKKNLHVATGSKVHRVLFEGRRARGIQLIGGEKRYASREVILSTGAIDTPKLLMLSGVGDAGALKKLGIPTVLDQPHIGRDLKDHPMVRLGATVAEDGLPATPLAPGPEDMAAAAQGYLRMDSSRLSTLSGLDLDVQQYLMNSLLPTHELLLRVMPSPIEPGRLLWIAVLVLMNTQSQGTVTLRSRDPLDSPVIDLNLLSHPYDMELAREAIKCTIPIIRESAFIPTEGLPVGPKTFDEEAITQYVRTTATHLWHACGSVKMGKPGRKDTCVTPDFKVQGLQGIRVADLSVTPVIPSHHTQSTAYLIGERAAELIIAEHGFGV